jgi:hypothetical protein
MKVSRLALVTEGALRAYLAPKLALDAGFKFAPVVKLADAKKWSSSKKKIAAAVAAGSKGKLAQDADIGDVLELLDQLDDVAEEVADNTDDLTGADPDAGADPVAAVADAEADKDGKAPPFTKKDDKEVAKDADKDDKVSKTAMDAAIRAAVVQAQKATVTRLNAIREAEQAVHPHVGALTVAMDSAEDVYKLALDAAQVDLDGVPPAAYAAMVRMLPKPGAAPTAKARPAMDAKANDDFVKRFPGAVSLKVR